MLRYAQKVAIAQQRVVTVRINADNTICLTYAEAVCNDGDVATHVLNPANRLPFQIAAPAGVSLGPPVSFNFDISGRANAQVALTVMGDGMTRNIIVENETGYVH